MAIVNYLWSGIRTALLGSLMIFAIFYAFMSFPICFIMISLDPRDGNMIYWLIPGLLAWCAALFHSLTFPPHKFN